MPKNTLAQLARRFHDKYQKGSPNECWEWVASRQTMGYGQFRFYGTLMLAHRVAYILANDSIPNGKLILHSCHNRGCVNPSHLRVGTHQDNTDDMILAGRKNSACGESHGRAKLSETQVREIRKQYSLGEATQRSLAHDYSVSVASINNIVNQKSWKST